MKKGEGEKREMKRRKGRIEEEEDWQMAKKS